jgi:hypothetical protein
MTSYQRLQVVRWPLVWTVAPIAATRDRVLQCDQSRLEKVSYKRSVSAEPRGTSDLLKNCMP